MIKHLSLSVLRIRDFRLFLLTRMCVTFALQAQAVVVGWQVYSITKDPFMLGLVGLAEALPAIICAFFSGHIVDTRPPLKLYVRTLFTLMLNGFFLLYFAGHIITTPERFLLPLIFAGVFFSGMARSFLSPIGSFLTARIVPRAEMPAALAWMTSAWQIAAVGGPAVGGLTYGGYGTQAAWMVPAFFISIAFFLSRLIRTAHVHNHEKREPVWRSIRMGWKFIWQTPVLLSVMTLDMFAVLFGGAIAMLPAYADQVLHVGSEGLGALRAAPALGAIMTALLLAVKPMKIITAKSLLWAVGGFGLCMVGFGLSTIFWISLLFLIASGVFDSISVLIRGTLMQLLTPDHVRGRVSSISAMFIISSNEIGAFESGTAAHLFGLVPSVVLGGIMTVLIVTSTAFLSPKLRKTVINTHDGHDADKRHTE